LGSQELELLLIKSVREF
jgi:hypothetical protein